MDTIDLESSLQQPLCSRCQTGRIRPINISGTHLLLDCPHCHCRPIAELPTIKKTLVYLDTSTVSHLARGMRAGWPDARWERLYNALCQATGDEFLCCVCSSIVESEAELTLHVDIINEMCTQLGNCKPRYPLDVENAQLFRALDRYLSGTVASTESSLPREDAWDDDPNLWQELLRIGLFSSRPPDDELDRRHSARAALSDEVTSIYARYATDELGFEAIRELEARGYGLGLLNDGLLAIQRRRCYSRSRVPLALLLQTPFDQVANEIKSRLEIGAIEAMERAAEFLRSDHVATIPIADIGSRLRTGMALMARGPTPRRASTGDAEDIEHIATFAPYVDVFIADGFAASLCNRPDVSIGDAYAVKIRSVGANDVDNFITEIEELRRRCAHLDLVNRVHQSIEKGGYIRERMAALQCQKWAGSDVRNKKK